MKRNSETPGETNEDNLEVLRNECYDRFLELTGKVAQRLDKLSGKLELALAKAETPEAIKRINGLIETMASDLENCIQDQSKKLDPQ